MHAVTLIKGDGIGPSIMAEAVKVIDASGAAIQWQEAYAGLAAFEQFGTPLPEATLASIDQTRLAF
ncbi:MAG: isocitrate/isopropylmalate family dehydrogenase, partial [Candidatus Thermoplasmatota archaeon]|nr:isocitrate/isopropylmalate family dehydrogenase [Candidatus Thermoplasmatota archaeon]MDD5580660.1 isocitrate/isopropylmalate family dehydrogenase [Methylobacter sp.]